MQRTGKIVGLTVKIGGFVPLTGNDQRCARFVDQDGVDLIDDGKVVAALNQIFFIDDHVVAQVVEAEFVGAVGDVCSIRFPAFVVVHIVNDQANGKPKKTINLTHPLGVAASEVIVDGDNVDSFAGKCVQIRRQRCDQRFSFTGLHFADASLMQYDAADDLHRKMPHIQHAPGSFAAGCKRLRKNGIQRGAHFQALAKLVRH